MPGARLVGGWSGEDGLEEAVGERRVGERHFAICERCREIARLQDFGELSLEARALEVEQGCPAEFGLERRSEAAMLIPR
eukprot:365981-Chlamydomonas_euryale.AAC.11